MKSLAERFWEKTEVQSGPLDTPCIVWTSPPNAQGYGQIRYLGKTLLAHRVVFMLADVDIPKGYDIDHLCRVRRCVNREHLEPVTRRENVLRGLGPDRLRETVSKLTQQRTECPQGHLYDGDNLFVYADGSRRCKTCHRNNERNRYAARKAAKKLEGG